MRTPFHRIARGALAPIVAALAIGCDDPSSVVPSSVDPPSVVPPSAVVLIVVDTLRADALGAYGYGRDTTPHLDAWAAEGRVFTHAYARSPWTLPSFGSLLTGQLPSRHLAGMRVSKTQNFRFRPLASELPTLPETLAEHSFVTGAVINNPYLHPSSGIARGFGVYDQSDAADGRDADESVDTALAWLDEHGDERFFLLLHFLDPHMPYDAPAPFDTRFTGARSAKEFDIHRLRRDFAAAEDPATAIDWRLLRDAYDEEVAFVDHELGRFFAALEARGLEERALVVFTSDHGEEFFEHGAFEHGHTVYDELLRVPLIVRGPGVAAGRDDRPVSLRDVPATVLDAVGLARPEGVDGRSLLARTPPASGSDAPLIASHTLYGDERQAAIAWPWKLHWSEGGAQLALFDLARDPAERSGVTGDLPPEAQRLARLLDEQHAASLRALAERGGETGVPMDPETEAQLRELGYLD